MNQYRYHLCPVYEQENVRASHNCHHRILHLSLKITSIGFRIYNLYGLNKPEKFSFCFFATDVKEIHLFDDIRAPLRTPDYEP